MYVILIIRPTKNKIQRVELYKFIIFSLLSLSMKREKTKELFCAKQSIKLNPKLKATLDKDSIAADL